MMLFSLLKCCTLSLDSGLVLKSALFVLSQLSLFLASTALVATYLSAKCRTLPTPSRLQILRASVESLSDPAWYSTFPDDRATGACRLDVEFVRHALASILHELRLRRSDVSPTLSESYRAVGSTACSFRITFNAVRARCLKRLLDFCRDHEFTSSCMSGL